MSARLTNKVRRGLSWVWMHAHADFESSVTDEVCSLSASEEQEVEAALRYIRSLCAMDALLKRDKDHYDPRDVSILGGDPSL